MPDIRNLQKSGDTRTAWNAFHGKVHQGNIPDRPEDLPFNSPPVSILMVLEVVSVETTEQLSEIVASICTLHGQEINVVRVARTITLQRLTETPVLVATRVRGLV